MDSRIILVLSLLLLAGASTYLYGLYTTYPNLPSIELNVEGYGVHVNSNISQENLPLDVYRNGMLVKSVESSGRVFLEYASPGIYNYEFHYNGKNMLGIEGGVKSPKHLEVRPVTPTINKLAISTLYMGYSANASAEVENASHCDAVLLLYPPKGLERAKPSVLKNYSLNSIYGLEYFSKRRAEWSWEEILFPKPTGTDTADYNVDLKMTCYDYYNSTMMEKTEKLPTSDDMPQASISISYARNESGTINGIISNKVWADFTCRLLVGDQSNYILEERNFTLNGRHDYEVGLDKYNRNLLYLTVICQDGSGYPITKVSTYAKE
ncbi:MAG: hypothetical protein WC588_00140 [Candidatus Micrarchaeia archaeon]